jgi:hypothetical protein
MMREGERGRGTSTMWRKWFISGNSKVTMWWRNTFKSFNRRFKTSSVWKKRLGGKLIGRKSEYVKYSKYKFRNSEYLWGGGKQEVGAWEDGSGYLLNNPRAGVKLNLYEVDLWRGNEEWEGRGPF